MPLPADPALTPPSRFRPAALLLLGVLWLGMGVASLSSGAMALGLREVWATLLGHSEALDPLARSILIDLRLPRVMFAALVGAALAVTGAVMQALFRNPLAEPGLIGVSAGGALGAVAAIVFTAGGFAMLASAAFAGSLGATALAYLLGRRIAGAGGLLLAGIAINTIAASLIGLISTLATDAQLRDLTFWSLGSLADAHWALLLWLAPWTLVWLVVLLRHWRVLNALLLGERETQHLGWSLIAVRRRLIVITALVVGPLVAATGGIGFIGLIVPHLMRMSLGADHRWLLPASALAGALALTLADWLCRVVVMPAELPIGMVTSLVGGPFFVWLLARSKRL